MDAPMKAFYGNDIEGMKSGMDLLPDNQKRAVRRNISFTALLQRKAEMLESIMSTWDPVDLEFYSNRSKHSAVVFLDEMDRVDPIKHPDVFAVLEQSEIRKKCPPQPAKVINDEGLRTRAAAAFDNAVPW